MIASKDQGLSGFFLTTKNFKNSVDFADILAGSTVLLGLENTTSDYFKRVFCYAVV